MAKTAKARPPKTVGIIALDAKEKTKCVPGCHPTECIHKLLLDLADEVRSLRYDAPDGSARFYDVEVVTKAGQVIRLECKWNWRDVYSTWLDREEDGHSRLTRQGNAVDQVLVVWDDFAVELQAEKSQLAALKGLGNWLGKKNLESTGPSGPGFHVVGSVQKALDYLAYLRDHREVLATRSQRFVAGFPKLPETEVVAGGPGPHRPVGNLGATR
jgi:hypothetical protein